MPTRAAAGRALLEREGELEVIAERIERAAAGEGALVVVEGHAGVGKTELLRAAAELGEGQGMEVVRGRGSELDRAFTFGLVRQLFERQVASEPELLSGGAEVAASVFAAGGGEARAEEGLFSSLQGLYWLVMNLAAHKPLIVLADDVHWADAPSLRLLVFLAERVEDAPVVVVAATRPEEPGADQELLDALIGSPAAHVVRPAPLSADATTTVVRGMLPDAATAFSIACHRASGGNPFLLGELLVELIAAGSEGAAEEAPDVLEFGPERVARAVRRRLRLLPGDATAVARAVAVLGPAATLDEAAALIGLSREEAAHAADALIGIHVLAAGRALDFVHPVVRSSVYDQIAPLECQALHVAAAEMLMGQSAEQERVARHLLRLPPAGNAERVAALRGAAREASKRGSAEAARSYLGRALEEPPPDDQLGAVLRDLGVAEATDRRRDQFVGHLRGAMRVASEPEERATIGLELGRALAGCGDFRASVEVFDESLRELDEPDGKLGVTLEGELLGIAFHEFSSTALAAPRWERRFRQLEAGEELDSATLSPLVLAIACSRGPAAAAIRLADKVDVSRFDELDTVLAGPVCNGLIYAGAISHAAHLYDASIEAGARRGSVLTVAWQSVMRSDASLRLGETRRAEAEARTGHDYFDEGSGEPGLAWTIAHLLNALVARGARKETEELLDRGHVGAGAPPSLPFALLLTARANAQVALGRPADALKDAAAAGVHVSPTISNPSCCAWRSAAARALLALERRDEASAMAEDELADARRFGIPDAEGMALRTLGLAMGGADGIDALRESVATLEGAEGKLEHAYSTLELGAALRRAGERVEARDILREALDETSRVGATSAADRAHAELIAAGGRPRRDRRLLSGRESLTASEDRAAALAAEGLTNREIAQRQFVTVKAVEWHLSNVYRKLGISSREELPEALTPGP